MSEKITLPGPPGCALKSRADERAVPTTDRHDSCFGTPSGIGHREATPFSPASVPLAVRSPYLSTWLPGSTPLNGGWAQHWAGATTAWTGYVKVCSEHISITRNRHLTERRSTTPRTRSWVLLAVQAVPALYRRVSRYVTLRVSVLQALIFPIP
jgi:hypothetical protein